MRKKSRFTALYRMSEANIHRQSTVPKVGSILQCLSQKVEHHIRSKNARVASRITNIFIRS